MGVGPAEAERAHRGTTRSPLRTRPLLAFSRESDTTALADAGIHLGEASDRDELTVVHLEHSLDQPGHAGGALQVADVALRRP